MRDKVAERVALLTDAGSFTEFVPASPAGWVTGTAKVNGRRVYLALIDPETVPANGFASHLHMLELLDRVRTAPAPVITVFDTPAQHQRADRSPIPQEPQRLLADKRGVGRWYVLQARLSGKVPQIAVVCSRMGAALTFPIALCDAAVFTVGSGMSVGRPDVVEKMLREAVDYGQLGGGQMHCAVSGSADLAEVTEAAAFAWVKRYLAYFPVASGGALPTLAAAPPDAAAKPLATLVPKDPNWGFAMVDLIRAVVDGDSLCQLREGYAGELITGLAAVEGRVCGIIANNTMLRGGLFFPESSRKAARFVSLCDAFGIPLVFLADSAGFMVGKQVEQGGSIRAAAQLFAELANAVVPKLSIAVRRDYTAGVYAMAGPGFEPDRFLALPTAVISIYGKLVAEKLDATDREQQSRDEMLAGAANPELLAQQGLVDAVIQPDDLRPAISDFLARAAGRGSASGRPLLLG
jgi:methylmalonyl-CoA decarboxylase subunit alpha